MIFVIGGYKSGKKQFVMEKFGFSESEFSNDVKSSCKILYDLQDMECVNQSEMLEFLLKKEIVICNEIGCGIVPIDKEYRKRRENVGRICIKLAKEAENVYRVYAGIGTKIK